MCKLFSLSCPQIQTVLMSKLCIQVHQLHLDDKMEQGPARTLNEGLVLLSISFCLSKSQTYKQLEVKDYTYVILCTIPYAIGCLKLQTDQRKILLILRFSLNPFFSHTKVSEDGVDEQPGGQNYPQTCFVWVIRCF